MHNELSTAAAHHPAIQNWERQLEEAQQHAREDETLFDRELFYALQPRERLESLIARYTSALGVTPE